MIKLEKINYFFRKMGEFELKYKFVFLAILVIVTIIGFAGLKKAIVSTSQEDWFGKNDPMTIATENFEKEFGNNEYIALFVESDDVFHPEVLQMIHDLGKELHSKVPYTDEITSLTELEVSIGTEYGVDIINPFEDGIPENKQKLEEIKELILSKKSFRNKIVTDDAKETWILISMVEFPSEKEWKTKTGIDPLYESGEIALKIINDEKWKSDIYTIKAAGMPVTETEEKEYMSNEMKIRLMSGFIVMIILLLVFLRSFRGVIIPIITIAAGIITVFGLMSWMRIKIDSMLMTLPVLLGMALSVGYSVHIINGFKDSFYKQGNRHEAVLSAIEHIGWPLFFTVITTVGSMLSFATIGIMTIKWLGFTCAAVVCAVYFYVIILIPIFMSFGKNRKNVGVLKQKEKRNGNRLFYRFGELVLKFRFIFMIFFLLISIFFASGLPFIRVNIDNFEMMGLKIPYIKRLHELINTKLGSYFSYNLTITFNNEDDAKDPENLKKFEILLDEIGNFELTKKANDATKVFSILDIIKDMYQTLNEDKVEYYKIPDDKEMVAQILLLYEMSGGTQVTDWVNHDYSVLRSRIDLILFDASELVKEFETIEKRAKELFPDAQLGLAGEAMQFARMHNMIVSGEVRSFLTALLVISLLMILVFASFKTGLIGMIPNITPVIILGGIMGYFNFYLDMMTMIIMPMILGVAVDDTIHFVNNIKYEFEKCGNYKKAILNSFEYIGQTLAMTTIILTATFMMYIPSTMNVLSRVGILAGVGLMSALIADYIMTPILIIWTKPFGKETNGGE